MGRKIDRCLWQIKGDFSSGSDLPIGKLHRNEDRGLVTTGSAREFKFYKRTIARVLFNLISIEVWRNWDVAEAPPVADEARHKEWQCLGENKQGHEAQFEP